mmetsp:Transcript_2455/g.8735  ORF Transcript_2455/g.8735 Transcript_2455/m.8735 type:complete len:230 (+) Transcript_2455:111-800(+)
MSSSGSASGACGSPDVPPPEAEGESTLSAAPLSPAVLRAPCWSGSAGGGGPPAAGGGGGGGPCSGASALFFRLGSWTETRAEGYQGTSDLCSFVGGRAVRNRRRFLLDLIRLREASSALQFASRLHALVGSLAHPCLRLFASCPLVAQAWQEWACERDTIAAGSASSSPSSGSTLALRATSSTVSRASRTTPSRRIRACRRRRGVGPSASSRTRALVSRQATLPPAPFA